MTPSYLNAHLHLLLFYIKKIHIWPFSKTPNSAIKHYTNILSVFVAHHVDEFLKQNKKNPELFYQFIHGSKIMNMTQ